MNILVLKECIESEKKILGCKTTILTTKPNTSHDKHKTKFKESIETPTVLEFSKKNRAMSSFEFIQH